MYSAVWRGMETQREGRGCDVAQMIFVGLEEMWFSSSLLFLITLTSVLPIRHYVTGSLSRTVVTFTFPCKWTLGTSGYSLDGHCKIEMIRWRPRRDQVTILANDENCMIRYSNECNSLDTLHAIFHPRIINKILVPVVLVGHNDQRHVVKRRILSSRFPALPNQSIVTGRWVQPNRIFQT